MELIRPQREAHWRRRHPPMADEIDAKTRHLLALGQRYEEEREVALADPDLTDAGKKKALATAGRRLIAALDTFKVSASASLRERAEQIEQNVLKRELPRPPADLGDRLGYELRLREIRDRMAGLSQLERTLAYMGSADPLVWAACETAPPVVHRSSAPGSYGVLESFVDPAKVDGAQAARVEAANPEMAAMRDTLKAVADTFESDVAAMKTTLYADAPDLAPSTVVVK